MNPVPLVATLWVQTKGVNYELTSSTAVAESGMSLRP
jgi:hypothetical protein